jgi:hypothetical protein
MKRRELLKRLTALGCMTATPSLAALRLFTGGGTANAENVTQKDRPVDRPNPLIPPSKEAIPVAFVVSDGAVAIDFAGPWEVFQDVHDAQGRGFFSLYTVPETTKPTLQAQG